MNLLSSQACAVDPRSIKIHKPPNVDQVQASALPDPSSPPEVEKLCEVIGAPDASSLADAAQTLPLKRPAHESAIASELTLTQVPDFVVDIDTETPYVAMSGSSNPRLIKIGSKEFSATVAKWLRSNGEQTTKKAVAAKVEELEAEAILKGKRVRVAARVIQFEDATRVIALHDPCNTHVYLGVDGVRIVKSGSSALLARGPSTLAMVMPADTGDYKALKQFVNLKDAEFAMWIGWVTYVLAHAKVQGNVFPILSLVGGMGTAKSTLARITKMLTDPDAVPVERMPANAEALALILQSRHVVALDNVRSTKTELSDALCMVATRGSMTKRRLYSDGDTKVFLLHGAVILNGIHAYVREPDLAQRTLMLPLEAIPESKRKPEDEIFVELQAQLPAIMRGLFELIAKILQHLPQAVAVHPHRLLGFVRWLAAWEAADQLPVTAYQAQFIEMMTDSQLDALQEDVLGSAVLEFIQKSDDARWHGTPAELLSELNVHAHIGTQRPPRGWPDNPIALSKRLAPLQAALMTQGVAVEFKRGKTRTITITFQGNTNDQ